MATQSGESPQALTEAETRDRDDGQEARHVRQNGNGLARTNGFHKNKREPCLRMAAIPRPSNLRATRAAPSRGRW